MAEVYEFTYPPARAPQYGPHDKTQDVAVNTEVNMSELLQGESVPCEEEQENNCGAKQQKNQSLKER